MIRHWSASLILLALAGCADGAASTPAALSPVRPAPEADAALTAYLRDRTRESDLPTRYVAATTGMGDEAMTLVYLSGPYWCGSGGCPLLILRRVGDGFEPLGELSVARTPVRILESRTNGRPDLGVRVAGGGVVDGYEALVPFDGRAYASNPTVPPARRVENAPGVTVIAADAPGVLLTPSSEAP